MPILLDVCPLSLGMQTLDGNMTRMLTKNTGLPAIHSDWFTTVIDNQETVSINIFEGEHNLTEHNNLLGSFELTGLSRQPKGVPNILVTFKIDLNGILSVTAEERETGNKNNITVTNEHNRLTPEDIKRMINDAEHFADEDTKMKKRNNAHSELQNYVYFLKNQVEDKEKLGSKLSASDKESIEKAVQEVIGWMESYPKANIARLKAQKKNLESVAQPIIEKLHGNAGRPNPEEGKQEKKFEL